MRDVSEIKKNYNKILVDRFRSLPKYLRKADLKEFRDLISRYEALLENPMAIDAIDADDKLSPELESNINKTEKDTICAEDFSALLDRDLDDSTTKVSVAKTIDTINIPPASAFKKIDLHADTLSLPRRQSTRPEVRDSANMSRKIDRKP